MGLLEIENFGWMKYNLWSLNSNFNIGKKFSWVCFILIYTEKNLIFTDSIFEGPKKLEDPFWALRKNPPAIEVEEPLGPTIHTPVPHFEDNHIPIFHETHPIEAPQFPPVPLHHPQHDFSTTPIPNFRKPYPKEVKQLTHTPGNSIPLKHHGPFKVQPLHVRGPTPPTTTLNPAYISTLPPRIEVTPSPSHTVISTTFTSNRYEPNYQYHPAQTVHHQIVSTQRPSGHPTIQSNQRPVHIHVGVVVTPTTAAPSYGVQHHFAQERKSNAIVSQLSDERFLKTTLAPFLTESR